MKGATMIEQAATTCTFTASQYRRDEMEQLLQALEIMGLDISYAYSKSGQTVEVTVSNVPDPEQARLMRTRGAGRKAKKLMPPDSSPFDSETPCEEFLAWRRSRGVTAEQAAKALGVGRATYYRQQVEQKMEDLIAEYAEKNPRREAKGMPLLTARIGQVTLGSNTYYKDKE